MRATRVDGVSRRAAHHAALRALPRARVSALPDPAQDRAHRRAHDIAVDAAARRAASSTRRTTAATSTTWSSRWCSTTPASGRRSSPPASTCSADRSGLIHQHVTGALPIRRNTKDPAYLITLKAYVAELLRTHDFFFYPEGGRSYSGELKAPKTGLFSACLHAGVPNLVIVPTAIAYDLVLEDHVLARQRVKRRQRPFSRELAEMVRYAVGYRSRAFVTFGEPIPRRRLRPRLAPLGARPGAPLMRSEIGRQYKVLPTALLAAAMRPSITRRELAGRIDAMLDTLRARRRQPRRHDRRPR